MLRHGLLITLLILAGCGGGVTHSGGQQELTHPKLDQAIAIINTDAELGAYLNGIRIELWPEPPFGFCCAAYNGKIILHYDYVDDNPVEWTIAALLHENLHLRELHTGRSQENEDQANAYASYGLNKLGLKI